MPLAEKYLALLRGFFLQNTKTAPVLIPMMRPAPLQTPRLRKLDIPKKLGARLPNPSDNLTTLGLWSILVAGKQLDNDVAGALAEALMKARRDLLSRKLPIWRG